MAMEQNTNRGPDGAITEPIDVIRVTKMTDQELSTRLEKLKKVSDPDEKLQQQIKAIEDEQKYRLDIIESLAVKLKAESGLGQRHFSVKFDSVWEKAIEEGKATLEITEPEEPELSKLGWVRIKDSKGRFISINPDSLEGKALQRVLG